MGKRKRRNPKRIMCLQSLKVSIQILPTRKEYKEKSSIMCRSHLDMKFLGIVIIYTFKEIRNFLKLLDHSEGWYHLHVLLSYSHKFQVICKTFSKSCFFKIFSTGMARYLKSIRRATCNDAIYYSLSPKISVVDVVKFSINLY